MTSSTLTCVAGWCGSMQTRQVGWPLIRTSSWILGSCAHIRYGFRVAIVRRIRSAIHESFVALDRAGVSGGVPWHQPRYGLVVCRGLGTAGEESVGGATRLA